MYYLDKNELKNDQKYIQSHYWSMADKKGVDSKQ